MLTKEKTDNPRSHRTSNTPASFPPDAPIPHKELLLFTASAEYPTPTTSFHATGEYDGQRLPGGYTGPYVDVRTNKEMTTLTGDTDERASVTV